MTLLFSVVLTIRMSFEAMGVGVTSGPQATNIYKTMINMAKRLSDFPAFISNPPGDDVYDFPNR